MRRTARLDPGFAWRSAALGGATVGLALAPLLASAVRGEGGVAVAIAAVAAVGLAAARPSGGWAGVVWLALSGAAALLAGLGFGSARLAAIDGGALDGPVGRG